MVEKKIVLQSTDDAKALVDIAGRCDFDVTLRHGKVQIDAKSIVGVLGLDLRRSMMIVYHGESRELQEFVEKHAAG